MSDTDENMELQDVAGEIKAAWEVRARSPRRDFYIASHPGWSREESRAAQIASDLRTVFHGLSPSFDQARSHILEIGCGNARLARTLAPRVQTYTGIDISPALIADAQKQCGAPNARFFESDGVSIPADATDRQYEFIFALAVFIHCPRPVITSTITAALPLVKPGGYFRAQFRADYNDREGLQSATSIGLEDDPAMRDSVIATVEEQVNSDEAELVADHYVGHPFRYAELKDLLGQLGGEAFDLTLFRLDPLFLYGELRRRG